MGHFYLFKTSNSEEHESPLPPRKAGYKLSAGYTRRRTAKSSPFETLLRNT
jgi:hypothetical protein